jgi:flagellar hook-associated protein 3 FlgL
MRVSDSMMGLNLINNLNRNKSHIEDLRTKIALNTKIRKPSDEPIGTARVVNLTDQLKGIETFSKNSDAGIAFLDNTIFHMESMQTEIEKIMINLADLNNGTLQDNKDEYAEKIDQAIKTLMDLANSEFDGKYLFGGTDHSEKPFGFDVAGTAIEVKVSGIDGEQKIQISKHITQKVNITGEELFGPVDGSDIFNTLIGIRDELLAGNDPPQLLIDTVSDFNDKIINKLSEAGNLQNRLYDNIELLNNQSLLLNDLVSREKDIDMAGAIMELQNQEYLLNLSYKLSASILPKSLMDFM